MPLLDLEAHQLVLDELHLLCVEDVLLGNLILQAHFLDVRHAQISGTELCCVSTLQRLIHSCCISFIIHDVRN